MEFPAISRQRIAKALTDLKLTFEINEDGEPVIEFEDLLCSFTIQPDHFSAWARWRGVATTEDDLHELRLIVNETNLEVPLVRASIMSTPHGHLPVGHTLFPATVGMTDAQIKDGLDYFFVCAHAMASLLNEAVGDLKTNRPGCEE